MCAMRSLYSNSHPIYIPTPVADPGFVERGGGGGAGGGCTPSRSKARKLSATMYIRDQLIMDAIREMNIAFDSVQCIRNNDDAMN